MSYLYLLVDSAGEGFKIGVSVNPEQRMAALPEKIDIENSFRIRCGKGNAYRVEKILHKLFQKYRLKKEWAPGYTEWFSMECFEAVRDFIHTQQSLLEWTHFEPIPELTTLTSLKSKISAEERRINRELRLKEEQIANAERNWNTVQAFAAWIDLLRERGVLVGLFNNRTCLAILNTEEFWQDENVFALAFEDVQKTGGLRFRGGGVSLILEVWALSSIKYYFVTICDLNKLDQKHYFDFDSTGRFGDPIKMLQNIVEVIPTIVGHQLIEVLTDYELESEQDCYPPVFN